MIFFLATLTALVLAGAALSVVYLPELMSFYDRRIRKKIKPVDPDRPVYRNDIPQKILDTKNPDIIAIYCLLSGDPEFNVAPITLDECRPLFAEHLIDEYITIRDELYTISAQLQRSGAIVMASGSLPPYHHIQFPQLYVTAQPVPAVIQQQLRDAAYDFGYHTIRERANDLKQLLPPSCEAKTYPPVTYEMKQKIAEAMNQTRKSMIETRGY